MEPATASPYQHHQQRVVFESNGHDTEPVSKLDFQVKPIINKSYGDGKTHVETSIGQVCARVYLGTRLGRSI